VRKLAELLWNDVNDSYHPETFQLIGPYSRAYGNDMRAYGCDLKTFIARTNVGYPLPQIETEHDHASIFYAFTAVLPMPFEMKKERFVFGKREFFVPSEKKGKPPVRLSQIRTKTWTLGWVDVQDEWSQRRNIIGHFLEADGKIGYWYGSADFHLEHGPRHDHEAILFEANDAGGTAKPTLALQITFQATEVKQPRAYVLHFFGNVDFEQNDQELVILKEGKPMLTITSPVKPAVQIDRNGQNKIAVGWNVSETKSILLVNIILEDFSEPIPIRKN
jgi:hypothetical protein